MYIYIYIHTYTIMLLYSDIYNNTYIMINIYSLYIYIYLYTHYIHKGRNIEVSITIKLYHHDISGSYWWPA